MQKVCPVQSAFPRVTTVPVSKSVSCHGHNSGFRARVYYENEPPPPLIAATSTFSHAIRFLSKNEKNVIFPKNKTTFSSK